jgi:hypothetical protein
VGYAVIVAMTWPLAMMYVQFWYILRVYGFLLTGDTAPGLTRSPTVVLLEQSGCFLAYALACSLLCSPWPRWPPCRSIILIGSFVVAMLNAGLENQMLVANIIGFQSLLHQNGEKRRVTLLVSIDSQLLLGAILILLCQVGCVR